MTDRRTIESVESQWADFETKEWMVKPLHGDYHVGAGYYLMVPTTGWDHEELKRRIAEVLDAMEAERNA